MTPTAYSALYHTYKDLVADLLVKELYALVAEHAGTAKLLDVRPDDCGGWNLFVVMREEFDEFRFRAPFYRLLQGLCAKYNGLDLSVLVLTEDEWDANEYTEAR